MRGREGGDALRHLEGELEALASRGLLRQPVVDGGDPQTPGPAGHGDPAAAPGLLDLCSNDYLGYGAEPFLFAEGRSGAGASRLVSGNLPAHEDAEAALAEWLGVEAALLFSSGYAANVGALSALARRGDLIVSDALNHASIIDGCRLSGAEIRVVPHRDTAAVAAALARGSASASTSRRWVVTESYFSMDGDSPDLPALRALCDAHDAALIVDEAHALGVLGPRGTGLCAATGVRPDVLIGTAGKALGLQGAFVAGSHRLRLWLWNRARSFVFSTGVMPSLALALRDRVRRVAGDDIGRARLAGNAAGLREGLAALVGLSFNDGAASGPKPRAPSEPSIRDGQGPVIPWVVGAPDEAVRLSRRLHEQGVRVQAIRPPTVPSGTSRLRITASARLTEADLDLALRAFRAAMGPAGSRGPGRGSSTAAPSSKG